MWFNTYFSLTYHFYYCSLTTKSLLLYKKTFYSRVSFLLPSSFHWVVSPLTYPLYSYVALLCFLSALPSSSPSPRYWPLFLLPPPWPTPFCCRTLLKRSQNSCLWSAFCRWISMEWKIKIYKARNIWIKNYKRNFVCTF